MHEPSGDECEIACTCADVNGVVLATNSQTVTAIKSRLQTPLMLSVVLLIADVPVVWILMTRLSMLLVLYCLLQTGPWGCCS